VDAKQQGYNILLRTDLTNINRAMEVEKPGI